MSNNLALDRPLPCQAERQKIINQAEFVLTEARATALRCDHTYGELSAGRPAEYTNAAAWS